MTNFDMLQEDAMFPWLADGSMADLDNNYNADLMDAMADLFEEEQEAMRESCQSEWSLTEINGEFIGFSVTNPPEEQWEAYDDQA